MSSFQPRRPEDQYTAIPPTSMSSLGSPAASDSQRDKIASAVAHGHLGGDYGPYSYTPSAEAGNLRFSAAMSDPHYTPSTKAASSRHLIERNSVMPVYTWDKAPEVDDALHDPRVKMDTKFTLWSWRGWLNFITLLILILGMMMLFLGYPLYDAFAHHTIKLSGYNLGGINGSGQIPDLNLKLLVDDDTPADAYSRTGSDGRSYALIFSDEFEQEGRTFYAGDDPYWEAMDIHYWPTGDLEWYDPQAVTTEGGRLKITMTEQENHNLNFQSGMIQSWNKFCFTTGYVEAKVSLPGNVNSPGFWPGVWTMGNLGRAGYGATTEGMWPYSYDACDLGTFPNQTGKDGLPDNTEASIWGGKLSYLPGQRTSACTCEGEDHPGPKNSMGRAVPEIDLLEAQIDVSVFRGQASQSFQLAPFDYSYYIDNSTITVYDEDISQVNSYHGSEWQEAASVLSYFPDSAYGTDGELIVGMEYWSDPDNRDDGYITWYLNGVESWTLPASALPARDDVEISRRLIPEEPMYLIINLGMSPSFQQADFKDMEFPAHLYVDYIRVYQRTGLDTDETIGCSPSNRPTADYITNHANAYSNPNLTTWSDAGYNFPLNSKYDGC
ncbi:beta-glucan synthesis-associated [Schizophyllum amplum]|uniref:Beta-glucan synthesis-associated n=1 Tax=Schizophyllum amplum TaxID=97359 RepID=A0A550C637_9AGAR|nr:beta-glucan synthesis-associated [Auriculariopsis ampla]